ncbi:MAG: ComEC/Rec2 family competence protein, partial [Pseudomonadota bacterium]
HAYFQGLGAHGYFLGRPGIDVSNTPDADGSLFQGIAIDLSRLRGVIAERIRDVLPGESGSLAVALTVADRRGVSPEVIETLRVSGLAHILAISGLHMALVAGTFFWFLRSLFCLFPGVVHRLPVKKYAAIGALAVATAYLLISGASVATRRAYIMLAIMLIAVLFDRRALTLRNVAIAAILIVAWTPSAVLGPGFQMSFAATAVLIATFGFWEQHRLHPTHDAGRPARRLVIGALLFIAGLALTSLVAGLATAPFALHHFNRIAGYGLLANVLAMPVVTFIVMPAGLAAMLAMPLGWERGPLLVMGEGLELVLAIARFVEGLGGAVVIAAIEPMLFAIMVSGLVVFVFARTGLRWIGALAMAGAFVLAGLSSGRQHSGILVSEDGRMVGIVSQRAIATNQRRPPTFVFEQWQRSLGGAEHRAPQVLAASGEGEDLRRVLQEAIANSAGQGSLFSCATKRFCVSVTTQNQRIVTVEDLAYLGPACDLADVVITGNPSSWRAAIPVPCWSVHACCVRAEPLPSASKRVDRR